jgi:hypothetical protein
MESLHAQEIFSTILDLAPLQVQNSPAGGLRQLNLRPLCCDKNGDPKKS